VLLLVLAGLTVVSFGQLARSTQDTEIESQEEQNPDGEGRQITTLLQETPDIPIPILLMPSLALVPNVVIHYRELVEERRADSFIAQHPPPQVPTQEIMAIHTMAIQGTQVVIPTTPTVATQTAAKKGIPAATHTKATKDTPAVIPPGTTAAKAAIPAATHTKATQGMAMVITLTTTRMDMTVYPGYPNSGNGGYTSGGGGGYNNYGRQLATPSETVVESETTTPQQ